MRGPKFLPVTVNMFELRQGSSSVREARVGAAVLDLKRDQSATSGLDIHGPVNFSARCARIQVYTLAECQEGFRVGPSCKLAHQCVLKNRERSIAKETRPHKMSLCSSLEYSEMQAENLRP